MLGKASPMRRVVRNGDAVQRRRVFMTVCGSVVMLSFLTIYYSSFFNSRFHRAQSVRASDNDPDMEDMKGGGNRHVQQQIVDDVLSRENEVIDLRTEIASDSHHQVMKDKDDEKEDVQEETEMEDADHSGDDLKDEEGIDEITLKSFPVRIECRGYASCERL